MQVLINALPLNFFKCFQMQLFCSHLEIKNHFHLNNIRHKFSVNENLASGSWYKSTLIADLNKSDNYCLCLVLEQLSFVSKAAILVDPLSFKSYFDSVNIKA